MNAMPGLRVAAGRPPRPPGCRPGRSAPTALDAMIALVLVVASDGFRPVSSWPSVTCVLLALLAIATASWAKCSCSRPSCIAGPVRTAPRWRSRPCTRRPLRGPYARSSTPRRRPSRYAARDHPQRAEEVPMYLHCVSPPWFVLKFMSTCCGRGLRARRQCTPACRPGRYASAGEPAGRNTPSTRMTPGPLFSSVCSLRAGRWMHDARAQRGLLVVHVHHAISVKHVDHLVIEVIVRRCGADGDVTHELRRRGAAARRGRRRSGTCAPPVADCACASASRDSVVAAVPAGARERLVQRDADTSTRSSACSLSSS